MSKIICDVCGTSYPETAAQCPICGCVRPGDAQSISGDSKDNEASGGYTYVKGGRFSKANVRKRNRTNQNSSYEEMPSQAEMVDEDDKKGNNGLFIVAIILLLAIVAVVVYIALHFFGPSLPDTDDTSGSTVTSEQDSTGETELDVPCESIKLDVTTVTLSKQGAARLLNVTLTPADTTDEITFTSSNEDVATVSTEGKVTAVGPGQATITVTCGDVSAECIVDCAFEGATGGSTEETVEDTTAPEEEFKLNRFDITFSNKGDSWMLYSGNLSLTEITWTSDDETVATIKNGKVVAVGSGMTKVYGEYNGEKVSCIIRCSFSDETENPGVSGSGGGVTEDGGSSGTGTYTISHEDVTLRLNVPGSNSFTLTLKDGSGKTVEGITWSVSNTSVCTVSGSTVTAVGAGTATVSVTYNGQVYSCIVRVS